MFICIIILIISIVKVMMDITSGMGIPGGSSISYYIRFDYIICIIIICYVICAILSYIILYYYIGMMDITSGMGIPSGFAALCGPYTVQ